MVCYGFFYVLCLILRKGNFCIKRNFFFEEEMEMLFCLFVVIFFFFLDLIVKDLFKLIRKFLF